MSRLALTIAGAVIGGIIGSFIPGVGTVLGAQLGSLLGSLAGALLFPPDPVQVEGPRLKDLSVQVSEYGQAIPIVWGSWRLAGNIIWAQDLEEVVTVEEEDGVETTTYTYFSTFCTMLCKGPIDRVQRIWANKKLIYDLDEILASSEVSAEFDVFFSFFFKESNFESTITIYTGKEGQLPDPVMESFEGGGSVPGYRERVLIVFDRLPLEDFHNSMPQIEVELFTEAGDTNLRTIVDDISDLVDIPDDCKDTSALETQIVRGFVASRVASARSFIDALRTPFFFDIAETQGTLKFKFRGGDPVATIAEDELGAGSGGASRELLVRDERTQEIELPEIVTINYSDITLDNQVGTAHVKRNQVATPTVNEFAVEVAVLLNPTEALAIAVKFMYLTWANRISYKWNTLIKHINLDPADIVTVIADGVSHEIMITRIAMGANNLLEFDGISNDIESFVTEDNLVPPDAVGFASQTLAIPGPITFEIIDVALLRNIDDPAPVVYVVTQGDNFEGSKTHYSLDGIEYTFGESIAVEGLIGTTLNKVPDYQCFGSWDETNQIEVTVPDGRALFNETKLRVYDAENIALVGDEIIGFRNAILLDPNRYRLTGLLRGIQGTDWAVSNHVAGERFVILSHNGSTGLISFTLSELNKLISYKSVNHGGNIADVTSTDITFVGNNLKPLSPSHIKGTWDGSDDLTITWIRRARVNAGWNDFGDLPLDEPVERYEVDVFTSNGVTFLRTITSIPSANLSVVTSSSQSAHYDNVDQTADGITAGDPVLVNVYQISSRVGRGFVESRVLDETPIFVSLPNQRIIVPGVDISLSLFTSTAVSTDNIPRTDLTLTTFVPISTALNVFQMLPPTGNLALTTVKPIVVKSS